MTVPFEAALRAFAPALPLAVGLSGGADSTALALGMDGVNRLFSNDNPLLRLGRDLGMGLVNALPGLRRGFIRQAAGLQGELPRLLAGKPI